MKKRLLIAVAVCVLGVAVVLAWRFYTSPDYSLRIIRKAVEEHDVTTFEKHVDIDGVVSRLLAELPDRLSEREELRMLGQAAVQVIQEFARESIVRTARTAARTFIERGHLDKKLTEAGTLSTFAKEAKLDTLKFVAIREVKKEAMICFVTTLLNVGAYDGDVEITFMMRDMGTYWQAAEITDVSDVLNRFAELKRAYRYKDILAATLYLLDRSGPFAKNAKNSEATIYTRLATAAADKNDAQEAEAFLTAALTVCEQMTEPSWRNLRANCIGDVGVVYFQLGQTDKAKQIIQSGATGWESHVAKQKAIDIAVWLVEQGRRDDAVREVSFIDNHVGKVEGLLAIASALQKAGDVSGVRTVLNQAKTTMRDLPDAEVRARWFGELGMTFALLGDQEEGDNLFAIAEENIAAIAARNDYHARNRAHASLALARNQLLAGRHDGATKAVYEAIEGFQGLRDPQYQYDVTLSLTSAAMILRKLERSEQADALIARISQKGKEEFERRIRSALLQDLIEQHKEEEALSSANNDELWLVMGVLAKNDRFEAMIRAAGRLTDEKERRSALLSASSLALVKRSGKQPELAREVMRIEEGK